MVKVDGRTLHYVIRSTDLKKTLGFLEEVFGMSVLRHEENDSACSVTCNGPFSSAWSKTMVGYRGHTEDRWFCLEVVYNYRVPSYPPPKGLREITVAVPDPDEAERRGTALGYPFTDGVFTGPDRYQYRVLRAGKGREEPFVDVALAVSDLQRAKQWYTEMLGMEVISEVGKECVVGYRTPDAVPVRLVADGFEGVDPKTDGRNAIALPTDDLLRVTKSIEQKYPDRVVHPTRVLSEDKLGALYLAITTDPDGHEICTVSKETFDPLVANPPYNTPDWTAREQVIKEKGAAGKEVDLETWQRVIADTQPVIAVFSSEWCGPCTAMKPVVAELERITDTNFIAVDIDKSPDVARAANVEQTPSIQLWRAGELVTAVTGEHPLDHLLATLSKGGVKAA